MVKAPASSSSANNLTLHNYQQYSAAPVFIKVHHFEMANDPPSSSAGISIAVPANRITTTATAAAASVPAHHTKANPTVTSSIAPAAVTAAPLSIHVPSAGAAAPRLTLHHIHPIAPLTMPAGPGQWPIVEPVFHFGPGFEHQHYCPTHSQGPQPHEHVVFFHVNAGVSVTFQIAGNREVIRGE